MISEKGISGIPSAIGPLNFEHLREKGLEYVQELAGDVWTDYNLHDPGVTLLEVLCYALSDVRYRIEHLKDTFKADHPVSDSFLDKNLFRFNELMPSLPITRNDFEEYIEKMNDTVILAWVSTYPLLTEKELVKGGYEVSVYLKNRSAQQDLNSDVIELNISPTKNIQVILFDENNQRLPWGDIQQIRNSALEVNLEDPFFQFETHNAQVALEIQLKRLRRKQYEIVPVKARISLIGINETISNNVSIKRYEEDILKVLEKEVFVNAMNSLLEKEHLKKNVLDDIARSLLPVRGLCEQFVSFRVVNIQEIKLDVKIELNSDALSNKTILKQVYDRLDRFLLAMVKQNTSYDGSSQSSVLYTSNLIEAITKTEGVKTVQVDTMNLFVDGVPTISLQEEGNLDCLNLQNFSQFIPKISREKSSVTFIRHGLRQTLHMSEVSSPFTPRSLKDLLQATATTLNEPPYDQGFNGDFFDNFQQYLSIQEDFPKNYRLKAGSLPRQASETVKSQQKRFKAYLLFFDRLLVDYLERIAGYCDQLSFKQEEGVDAFNLNQLLSEKLLDVKNLDLIDKNQLNGADYETELWQENLERKNKILDHLLARFATPYESLRAQGHYADQYHVAAKTRLLRDIPKITSERGLGLPLQSGTKGIWEAPILSGLQYRIYRLLGIDDDQLLHHKLTAFKGRGAKGFYMIEHLLLTPKTEYQVYDKKLNKASVLIIDFLKDLDQKNAEHFSFSFELTLLIPSWYSEWNSNRKAYERLIKKEVPAHIKPNIYWVDKKSLQGFEVLFEDWLAGLFKVHT